MSIAEQNNSEAYIHYTASKYMSIIEFVTKLS
jgi:hypothetical protein